MKKIFTFVIILLFSLQIAATAQPRELPQWLGVQNNGTDFWFTIPPCMQDESGSYSNFIKIYVTSEVKTLVTLEVKRRGLIKTIKTTPNNVFAFDIHPSDAMAFEKRGPTPETEEQIFSGAGIHVYAEDLITVFAVVRFRYTSDGFLVAPVSCLGTEYICGTYNTDPMFSSVWGYHLPSMCGITAAYNDTKMTFTMGGNAATTTAGGLKPGQSTTVTMNKGDVFMVSAKGDYGDLAGSKIVADKPVSVVSGNMCDNIPAGNQWCDYCAEMEMPTFAWGKEYHVVPVPGRKYPSIIRIFAKEPNTSVYMDGKQISILKNAGGIIGEAYYETRITPMDTLPRPAVISGDKPIGIMLYNCGVQEDGYPLPNSDPFWMVMTPVSQYLKEITFNTPAIKGGMGFEENYMHLIYQTDGNSNMPDDVIIGESVGGSFTWSPVNLKNPGTDKQFNYDINDKHYAVHKLTLPREGVFKIKASQPFAAYSFGYNWCDSYGYPPAASFRIDDPEDKECPKVAYTLNPDSSVNGTVSDKNLTLIFMLTDQSYNYKLTYPEFLAGTNVNSTWKLEKIYPNDSARAVIAFADRCGYDTVIAIGSLPRAPDPGLAKIVLNTTELEFHEVNVNNTRTLLIVATNRGQSYLSITDAKIINDINNDFSWKTKSNPIFINVDEKDTILVTFQPKKIGSSNAILEIKTNDTRNEIISIRLRGYGIDSRPTIKASIYNISFGNVKLESTANYNISFENLGFDDLSINKISIEGDQYGVFSIVAPTFPIKVIKDANTEITIKFTPYQNITYKAVLHIESNASNTPVLDIPIEGTGGDNTDVSNETQNDNLISLSAKPNPISKNAIIEYNVEIDHAVMLKLTVVDIAGREVALLLNQTVEPGQNSIQFSAENLPAGKYFVIANAGNAVARLPIVVEK
ncbi:MAG: hypothetical protein HW421_2306 [Ignavibacteria bacterium]|nr:hypothetical protein [Ignavibacteria bacterium]